MHFRMPSSQSVARNARRLATSRSRLTIGAAAASVATVAAVAAASSGPATSMTGQLTADTLRTPAFSAYPTDASSPLASAAATAGESAVQGIAPGVAGHSQAGGSPRVTSAQPTPAASATALPAAAASPASSTPAPTPQPAPQPYWIYDSVTPSTLPSSSQAVAVYANGSYAAAPSQVGKRGLVLWIDTQGTDPNANVLDVEPGDATPAQAATWVAQKLDASPNSVAIVYTMRSEWPAVQAAINALPWWMPSHTQYWIADPTGVPHIVPGSMATQWYWGQNYDISTALPGF